jgi:hypothetical protein
MTNPAPRDRNAALMISLTLGLVQAAYQQLGKLKSEVTGKIDPQLDAARVTIDTLAALEDRTRGRRSDEETQVLERALAELRMNYVDEVKKAAAAPAAEAPPSPEELKAETPGAEAGTAGAAAPADADAPPSERVDSPRGE